MTTLLQHLASGLLGMVPQNYAHSSAVIEHLSRFGQHQSLGQYIADHAVSDGDVLREVGAMKGFTVLTEVDVLFDPRIDVSAVDLLRQQARRTPLVVAWPGEIIGNRLVYSAPGRADHVDAFARGCLLLHPIQTTFPDEVPYRMEIVPL